MADNNDKIGINLVINGDRQHLTIPRDKEKVFRDAADLINERFNKYRQSFQNQSSTRYTAFVMLDIAVRYLQTQDKQDTQPFTQSMTELLAEIEETIGPDV